MRFLLKYLTVILLTASIVLTTGCPQKAKMERTVRTAKEQSAVIKTYAVRIVQANISAYRKGEIRRATLAELNKYTGVLREGIEIYDKAVAEAEKMIKEGAEPKTVLDRLASVFSEQVVNAFLAVVEKIRVLAPSQSEALKTVFAGIRMAILAIQMATVEAFMMGREERWS